MAAGPQPAPGTHSDPGPWMPIKPVLCSKRFEAPEMTPPGTVSPPAHTCSPTRPHAWVGQDSAVLYGGHARMLVITILTVRGAWGTVSGTFRTYGFHAPPGHVCAGTRGSGTRGGMTHPSPENSWSWAPAWTTHQRWASTTAGGRVVWGPGAGAAKKDHPLLTSNRKQTTQPDPEQAWQRSKLHL